MNTLIVYASKHGSTEKCANIIAENLRKHSQDSVDIINVKSKQGQAGCDFALYDRIIIGSSIYVGQTQKEVKEFCRTNLPILLQKQIGLFICCMFDEERAEMQLQTGFPEELVRHATAKEVLGGEFQFQKMNFLEKIAVKLASKNNGDVKKANTSQDISTISSEKINKFVNNIIKISINT
ncbi:hypothetical protein BHU72_05510 [Desulfuribacillus stibiiarsenatis]|uniref:Flavodoxin domain-containing protein n=1 Tax=Desulfuribacillus stibiiarsenatis TaxID=1390249 RepID=A0A1E5L4S7_9FIRM|nr:flavodoxin domain-containing protein [Desulfuribacillus stibiiarsenatis]OEH85068.1 hypothetical protein BHU72_05510 [Desulfuribacillus stibiiarsenatis]